MVGLLQSTRTLSLPRSCLFLLTALSSCIKMWVHPKALGNILLLLMNMAFLSVPSLVNFFMRMLLVDLILDML